MVEVMREDVLDLLVKIKRVLNRKNSIILSNREKNNLFCIQYSLSSKVLKRILSNLTIYDFAKCVNNEHSCYADEKLYLFAPQVELIDSNGKKKMIQIYLKINYVCNTIVIISCHECEYTLKYAFKCEKEKCYEKLL